MSNLLVVDWDYFFPNPLEAGIAGRDGMLYDWGHRESPFFIDMVWHTRAATFLGNDLKLPEMTPDWKTFPDRFTLKEDAIVYVADSNAHSGSISAPDGGPFSDVWLYDAHHDCGYGVPSFKQWMRNHTTDTGTTFSCEDWMLIHLMQDTSLHWRFPTWHESFKEQLRNNTLKDTWPKGVTLDAQCDSLAPLRVDIDTVFICRSGAWVPSWEDRKFIEFTNLWGRDVEQLDDCELDRSFNIEQAKQEADMLTAMRVRMT